jgi:hypothetical protein
VTLPNLQALDLSSLSIPTAPWLVWCHSCCSLGWFLPSDHNEPISVVLDYSSIVGCSLVLWVWFSKRTTKCETSWNYTRSLLLRTSTLTGPLRESTWWKKQMISKDLFQPHSLETNRVGGPVLSWWDTVACALGTMK